MKIEVNGTEYQGWTKAQATINLDTLSNAFSFSATSKEGKAMPFRGGESCRVKVDGEKVITGHIEIVNVDGDANTHTISLSGRDNTGDVLDSKIGSLSDIRPPISLENIIKIVLTHINSPVKVISEYSSEPFKTTEDLAAPEFGQDVWDFIQSLARKRQVLLSSNADGNILITRSSGRSVAATIQNKIKSDTNNVISHSVSYDTTGLYSMYRSSSQQNPVSINDGSTRSNYSIAEQVSAIQDRNVRAGRQLAVTSEMAGSNMLDRNKWEYNIRKARSQTYSATVHGFRNQTGDLWEVNTVIHVVDEFSGIDARMLVNSVQFTLDDNGRQAVLGLVHKDAYTLALAEDIKIDKIGTGLVEPTTEEVVEAPGSTEPGWKPWSPSDIFGG